MDDGRIGRFDSEDPYLLVIGRQRTLCHKHLSASAGNRMRRLFEVWASQLSSKRLAATSFLRGQAVGLRLISLMRTCSAEATRPLGSNATGVPLAVECWRQTSGLSFSCFSSFGNSGHWAATGAAKMRLTKRQVPRTVGTVLLALQRGKQHKTCWTTTAGEGDEGPAHMQQRGCRRRRFSQDGRVGAHWCR